MPFHVRTAPSGAGEIQSPCCQGLSNHCQRVFCCRIVSPVPSVSRFGITCVPVCLSPTCARWPAHPTPRSCAAPAAVCLPLCPTSCIMGGSRRCSGKTRSLLLDPVTVPIARDVSVPGAASRLFPHCCARWPSAGAPALLLRRLKSEHLHCCACSVLVQGVFLEQQPPGFRWKSAPYRLHELSCWYQTNTAVL